jgi:murein DD-endopeptidase MepM/ murein hydrolase activator NlpD
MKVLEGVSAKQIIYIIDAYRIECATAYGLLAIFLILPLVARTNSLMQQRNNMAFAAYEVPTYPISQHKAPIAQVVSSVAPVWPIHGKVTTEFGVPHQPWQRTHTGIDISSAKPSGVTVVTVFEPGTVVDISRSGGYGNHVTVDHGGGLTSLYGHLNDISVRAGQAVRPGDVLGHEGRTGTATGTHLHFEVLLNGTPVNPHRYVPGSP